MSSCNMKQTHQPYIPYIGGTSRETTISEAIMRLEMADAVKTVRRFNYVCKVLKLLLDSRLSSLSGTAQKQVFNVLEAASNHVPEIQYSDVCTLRELLKSAAWALKEGEITHIGSKKLWALHQQNLNKMKTKVDAYKMVERESDGKLTMDDLPDECVRAILTRLPDHEDIMRTSLANHTICELGREWKLWRQLCLFHFSDTHLAPFVSPTRADHEIDWKTVYRRCLKKHGKKICYGDMLALCSHCKHLFWMAKGHPCYSKEPPACTPLDPQAFLNLFYL